MKVAGVVGLGGESDAGEGDIGEGEPKRRK